MADEEQFRTTAESVKGLVQGSNNAVSIYFSGQRDSVDLPTYAPPGAVSPLGRDVELRRIQSALENEYLVSIYGLPGVGKTTIAAEVANASRGIDGVLWAHIGRHREGLKRSLNRWAGMLQVELTPALLEDFDELRILFHNALGDRHALVVVDDVWRSEDVVPFLVGGPDTRRVVTTRSSAVASDLPGMSLRIEELADSAAAELVLRWMPGLPADYSRRISTICGTVGNLPLGLFLLARFLRSNGGEPFVKERLDAAIERIQKSSWQSGDSPVGEDSKLGTAISISLAALEVDAQFLVRVAALLSPKPNTVSLEFLLEVSGLPVETLYEVIDAGLLELAGRHRYYLHQTIVDHVSVKDVSRDVELRLSQYFTDLAIRCHRDGVEMTDDHANLLTSLDLAFESGRKEELVTATLAVSETLVAATTPDDAQRRLHRALRAARQIGDEAAQRRILLGLARIGLEFEGATSAEDYLSEALQISQDATSDELSELLVERGRVRHVQGRIDSAIADYEAGLEAASNSSKRRGLSASACLHLAEALHSGGQEERAEEYAVSAIEMARIVDEKSIMSAANGILAWSFAVRGRLDSARAAFEAQRELSQGRALGGNLTNSLDGLGWLSMSMSHYREAAEYYREGLQAARSSDHFHVAALSANYGHSQHLVGNFAEAEAMYRRAISVCDRYTLPQIKVLSLTMLGSLMVDQGRSIEAIPILEEAAGTAKEKRYADFAASALGELALAYIGNVEHSDKALDSVGEAISIAESLSNTRSLTRLLYVLGSVQLPLDLSAAMGSFERLLRIASENDFPDRRALAEFGLAKVASSRGLSAESDDLASSAERSFATLGHFMEVEVSNWRRTDQSD